MRDDRVIPALGFDALTPLFDSVVEVLGYGTGFKLKVLAAAQLRNGERLLDVGCGTGTLLKLAQEHAPGALALGIDADKRVLEIARHKLEGAGARARLIAAGAQQLPLPDASIDLALSSLIFHHLPPRSSSKRCARSTGCSPPRDASCSRISAHRIAACTTC